MPDHDADDWLFRPVWEDTPDETETPEPPPRMPPLPRPARPADLLGDDAAALLAPLAAAQDALARLDARAALAPPPLRAGLIARLAFREAAGLLAAARAWVHPLDLALREHALVGRFDTAAEIGRARQALPNTWAHDAQVWRAADDRAGLVAAERAVPGALHLARLLRALPDRHDPLATPAAVATTLGPLGPTPEDLPDPDRLAQWRHRFLPRRAARRSQPPPLPALLTAAQAAAAWMEDGIVEQPTAAQALAAAALLLRRTGALRVIPLVVWAAYPLLAEADAGGLPRLRGEVARRLTGHDSATWMVSFLAMAAEAARAGLRELDRLQAAAAAGAALTTRDPRARLDDALAAVLRHPALTPAMLAQRLGITPQAASRLLARLAAAGIVTEITGRKSFRAFAIMATRSVPESSRE
jgi:hypothetical protein